jgi:hypothetical protein
MKVFVQSPVSGADFQHLPVQQGCYGAQVGLFVS